MESLRKQGFPEDTIDTTLQSLSKSTINQYDSSFRAWWTYCQKWDHDLFNSSASTILSFLQEELKNKGSKYGTLNQHRSALSLILPGEVGKNMQIKRFLKGAYRLNPPRPKYKVTWYPQVVLQYLEQLENNYELSLFELSKKLATLLALATGHRLQTLQLIRTENIVFTATGVRIFISDNIKTSRLNSFQPCLEMAYFPDRSKICVVFSLIAYVERTAELRITQEDSLYLFIRSTEPYSNVSRATIAKWIKATLAAAGINTQIFGAHSTRHASTSKAFEQGISWDQIRTTVGWSESSLVFGKPIMSKSFNEAVFTITEICQKAIRPTIIVL